MTGIRLGLLLLSLVFARPAGAAQGESFSAPSWAETSRASAQRQLSRAVPSREALADPYATENLASAAANATTYDVFWSFKAARSGQPDSNASCFGPAQSEVPAGGLIGISPKCPSQWGHAPPPGYRPTHVACATPLKNSSLVCSFFVVIYAPENKDSGLPPIVDFKGTTEPEEWKANILSRGGSLIQNALGGLFSGRRGKSGAQALDFADALYKYSLSYPPGRLVFSGHSLGGAMAQNLALGYARYLAISLHRSPHDLPPVQVITFNSLAGQSMAESLSQSLPDLPIRQFFEPFNGAAQAVRVPLGGTLDDPGSGGAGTAGANQALVNVTSRHFATADDPLNAYNRATGKGNFGGDTLLLPSIQNVDDTGRMMVRIHFDPSGKMSELTEGHAMESVIEDLNYAYSKDPDALVTELKRRSGEAETRYSQFLASQTNPRNPDPASGGDLSAFDVAHGLAMTVFRTQIEQLQTQRGSYYFSNTALTPNR